MANFQMHITAGIFAGIAAAGFASQQAGISDSQMLLLVSAIAAVGSLLPDIDSDSGTPLRILFGGLGVIAGGVALLGGLKSPESGVWELAVIPTLVYLAVHFVVAEIFKRFTKHRGIFHSFPALCIAAFSTFLLASTFDTSQYERMLLAGSMGLGYLSHLVLDEIFAATNLNGRRLKVNHMFGTALKFRSNSKLATSAAYVAAVILGYMSFLRL